MAYLKIHQFPNGIKFTLTSYSPNGKIVINCSDVDILEKFSNHVKSAKSAGNLTGITIDTARKSPLTIDTKTEEILLEVTGMLLDYAVKEQIFSQPDANKAKYKFGISTVPVQKTFEQENIAWINGHIDDLLKFLPNDDIDLLKKVDKAGDLHNTYYDFELGKPPRPGNALIAANRNIVDEHINAARGWEAALLSATKPVESFAEKTKRWVAELKHKKVDQAVVTAVSTVTDVTGLQDLIYQLTYGKGTFDRKPNAAAGSFVKGYLEEVTGQSPGKKA